MSQCVITFPSIYHAFRAKKILKQQGIEAELIPVPPELSESCQGLAARIDQNALDAAVEVLGAKGIAMVKQGINIVQAH